MRAGELQHRALDDAVVADGFFSLSGEGLKRRGEILSGSGLLFCGLRGVLVGFGRRSQVCMVMLQGRLGFGGNSGVGV